MVFHHSWLLEGFGKTASFWGTKKAGLHVIRKSPKTNPAWQHEHGTTFGWSRWLWPSCSSACGVVVLFHKNLKNPRLKFNGSKMLKKSYHDSELDFASSLYSLKLFVLMRLLISIWRGQVSSETKWNWRYVAFDAHAAPEYIATNSGSSQNLGWHCEVLGPFHTNWLSCSWWWSNSVSSS